MARYTIILLKDSAGRPSGSESIESEEGEFASEAEAIRHAKKIYESNQSSATGFLVYDAMVKLVDEWRRLHLDR